MAYYYFDEHDHITTLHNADIYLLANVGNYHDYNGESITFNGFYLTGGKTFTIGGNYTGSKYNIYQYRSSTADVNTKSNKIFAAVGFAGDGELNISSQIGAPDGKKHDDKAVRINAYQFLSNDKATSGPLAWQHYKGGDGAISETFTIDGRTISLTPGANVSWNQYYNTSGQVADITGIYAKNNLTIASNYNGYIRVEGQHESIGMKNQAGTSIFNTAIDTSTIAAGLRGDDQVKFNGNFFGNIHSSVQVHFQSAATYTLTGNTVGAYGVFSKNVISQNNIHAGSILTTANDNYFDATIAKNNSGHILANNELTSAGLRAKQINIRQLDTSFNDSYSADDKIKSLDLNAEFEWTNIQDNDSGSFTDISSSVNDVHASDGNSNVLFYISADDLDFGDNAPGYGESIKISLGSTEVYGTFLEGVIYDSVNKGYTGSDVICLKPANRAFFELFKAALEGEYANEDIPLFRFVATEAGGTATFEADDVANIIVGRISATITENEWDEESINYSKITWEAVNPLTDGCYIFNIDGAYIRIEASAVIDNGNGTLSYTFTADDADKYSGKLDLSSIDYNENNISGYYEIDYTNNNEYYYNQSNSFNSGTISFISQNDGMPDFSADYTVTSSDPANGQSASGTITSLDSGFKITVINIPGDTDNNIPALKFYEYTTKNEERFNAYIPLDQDILIRAEANDNIFKVTDISTQNPSNNLNNNIIQAIGIYGEETLTIDNFVEGSKIETVANNNEMHAEIKKGSIEENTIYSIGIYGATVNLKDFYGTINVTAYNNYIDKPSETGYKNYYAFAGIKANNLNVDRNLYGNINIDTYNNTMPYYLVGKTVRNNSFGGTEDLTHSDAHNAGIFAGTITVDGFIKSDITITSIASAAITSGVYAENTLDAKGFSGDISISAIAVGNTFGIYAQTFKSDLGYYYSFIGADANNDYGNNAQNNKIVVALDTFNVEGSILINANLSQIHGIATRDTANLYLNGTVITVNSQNQVTDTSLTTLFDMASSPAIYDNCFAVKTDFGNDVNSGFKNDIVQLGSNATVFGIIDMGGGNNNITFDDDARFFGFIFHDNGKINITYSLNGAQERDGDVADHYAIHTINSECDATLSSNTTISIDCNNIEIGETYNIIKYVDTVGGGTTTTDLADAHWKTGAITISYMGESRLIYLNNYNGFGQIDGSNGESIYVKVNYDTTRDILSLTALEDINAVNDPVQKPITITTISIATETEDAQDQQGNPLKDENGIQVKNEIETVSLNKGTQTETDLAAAKDVFERYMQNKTGAGQTPDYVTYTRNENTYSATASTSIYWMCSVEEYKYSSYEIIYEVKNGNDTVHTALLRLNTVDGNKESFSGTIQLDEYRKTPATGKIYLVDANGLTEEEWKKANPNSTATFQGAYYIMSYDINSVEAGCTIEYKIRDYSGDGYEISPWQEGTIETERQEFAPYIKDLNSNYMVAINPDDDSRRVGSSIALFTWQKADSNYAIDNYTIQYFSSTKDLSGEKALRDAIYAAYENASKTDDDEDVWQDADPVTIDGTTYNIQVFIASNGEVQLRTFIDGDEVNLSDGSTIVNYDYYNFVSKTVSGTELLASGLANQSYIYWRVQAKNIEDAKNTWTSGTRNNWVEGNDFRIFLGDTEGPAFVGNVEVNSSLVCDYDPVTKKFTISDFTWGDNAATDEKSGTRYYIIEASPKDQNQWKEVYSINSYEFDEGPRSWDFNVDPGIYDIRVRPIDAAGNSGTPSSKITIYAVDNKAPSCILADKSATEYMIGEGEAEEHIGWNYSYEFDPAVDPVSDKNEFQTTGISEYTVNVYYTDTTSGKNIITSAELWGWDGTVWNRIGNINSLDYKFTNNPNYSKYKIVTGDLTYFQLDGTGKPVIDAETERYKLNNNRYYISLTVSDIFGNVTTVIDEEINASAGSGGDGGGDTPKPEGAPPEGSFLSISEAIVKATHKITERDEQTGEGENSESETIMQIGDIEKVTATFTWQDNFESNNGVYYLMQFSDSNFFNTKQTYTVLVLPSTMSDTEQMEIYSYLYDKYDNLRVYVVDSAPASSDNNNNNNNNQQTTTSGEKWRQNGITTIVMDNLTPTAAVGMLQNSGKTYWQVKSIDRYGNENTFSPVQNLEFKSDLTHQTIVETGEAMAPYNVLVETETTNVELDSKGKAQELFSVTGDKLIRNTGDQKLSFDILNDSTLLGYDYITVEYNSKNGGNSGTLSFYAMFGVQNKGNVTHCYDAYLYTNTSTPALLREGDYTITVKAYDYNGTAYSSEAYTFVQDYTRPIIVQSTIGSNNNTSNSTIKVAFDKPAEDTTQILTTVSWPLALDKYGIKGYVLSYRCTSLGTDWTKAYVNGSNVIETNSCQITLFKDQTYEFAVYAIDNNGNTSEETVVKNVFISYKDIDDPTAAEDNPNYTVGGLGPITIYSQLIGGSDQKDNIFVSSDDGNGGRPGEIQLTIFNLNKINGSGNSIIVDVYEDNGGEVKIKSYTFALNAQTQSSTGLTVKHLVENSGSNYRFEVRSGNANTIMQYDLHYNFDWFDTTPGNNSAFKSYNGGAGSIDFDTSKTDTTENGWNIYRLNIGNEPTAEKPFANRVGYGDPSNYTVLHLDTDGLYSFEIAKGTTDSLSALSVTISQMMPGATALKTVKSFSIAANKLEAALNDLNLAAGDYVVQVTSTSAKNGANVRYNLQISTREDKYFTAADSNDNTFMNNEDVITVAVQPENNPQFILGAEETGNYIGIGDAVDFRKIKINQAGEYTFDLYKFVYEDDNGNITAYGTDGALTLTIYELQDGKTALTSLKTVTVNAKKYTGSFSTLLDEGEYYVEVKATAPTKTALEYAVSVNAEEFKGDESANITDTKEFSSSISAEGLIYLNATNDSNSYNYIGFGEDKNYMEVNLAKTGSYTFTVNRSLATAGTEYSAIKATLYKTNAAGTGFTAVKSVSLSNANYSSVFTIDNLEAGQYFIEIIATDAAKGKFADYNVSVNAANLTDPTTAAAENYINAEVANVGTEIFANNTFYKFDTGNMAGSYNFTGIKNLYYLKDGTVNLTKVSLSANSAYLDADTTYYIEAVKGDSFQISKGITEDISTYTADNNFVNLPADAQITNLGSRNSWVGYGDLESWTKLTLENGGNFDLALRKAEVIGTAVTVTVYEMAANGTSLKAVGNFSVAAGKDNGLKTFLLKSGEYYIQVKSTTPKGNTDFTLSLYEAQKDTFYTDQNVQDNFFDNAVTVVEPAEQLPGTDQYVFGSSTETEYIGIRDAVDFRKINVTQAGEYTFNLNKLLNSPEHFDGALTLSIYELQAGKTALTKLKSITVNAKVLEGSLSAFLDKGEYYIEVRANAPATTSFEYAVTVETEKFAAVGSANITDAKEFTSTISTEGSTYLNATNDSDSYNYIGFGEDKNYMEVTLENTGNYTFTINRAESTKGTDFSAVKATLYKTNAAGTGFTSVKSVTVTNITDSSTFMLSNLAAGQYFIEIVAVDAAKGKFAEYNVSVDAANLTAATTATAENFINAAVVSLGSNTATDDKFYQYNTGNMTGSYTFTGIKNLYYLKDGTLNLTRVSLSAGTAYLDANTTYYIETTPNADFEITENTVKDISTTVTDNDFVNLPADAKMTGTGSRNSWVGYGDLESWTKLHLDQGGYFDLSLAKAETVGTAVTVTVYEMAANGTSLKAIGNFSVAAGKLDGVKNYLLKSGDYYIQVKSTTPKGNTDFTITLDEAANKGFTAKVDTAENDTALTEASISTTASDWVGFTDEYDYFNVEVTASGYYDFSFSNTDAAQVVLYIVNPTNGNLAAVATYNASTAANKDYIFTKDGSGIMLDSDSQYIAMVKSTNAAKGGNCDYTLTVDNKNVSTCKLVIEKGANGKYIFDTYADDLKIQQFNAATGKLTNVTLSKNTATDELYATLAVGEYFITSATSSISFDQETDLDKVNKIITIY